MLSTELAAGGKLRLVSGEDVARVKRELSLTAEDSLAKPTLERLRINPGADIIVLGAYTLLPTKGKKRIRLDVRLQDTADGATISEDSFTGNEDELFELASQAGIHLRKSLGIPSSGASVTDLARASQSGSTLRAARSCGHSILIKLAICLRGQSLPIPNIPRRIPRSRTRGITWATQPRPAQKLNAPYGFHDIFRRKNNWRSRGSTLKP